MVVFVESFVFGAVNSLHCAGMCGPLAACFHGGVGPTASYHFGRTAAYGVVGLLAGAVGSALGAQRIDAPSAWIAFGLAGVLALFAIVGDRWLGAVPGIGRVLGIVLRKGSSLPPPLRAGLVGGLTPLLPCGLLYAIYGAALVSGSALQGLLVMLGFALGSLPLLFLVQSQLLLLRRYLGPRKMVLVQKVAMLTAAAVLVWRGVVELEGASCCH